MLDLVMHSCVLYTGCTGCQQQKATNMELSLQAQMLRLYLNLKQQLERGVGLKEKYEGQKEGEERRRAGERQGLGNKKTDEIKTQP